MSLKSRVDKFVNSKPTKFEKIAVGVFAGVTAIGALTVITLIVIHLFIGDLF